MTSLLQNDEHLEKFNGLMELLQETSFSWPSFYQCNRKDEKGMLNRTSTLVWQNQTCFNTQHYRSKEKNINVLGIYIPIPLRFITEVCNMVGMAITQVTLACRLNPQ